MIRPLVAAVLFVLAGLSGATAAYVDLDTPVAGHPGKVWADLVRAVAPDLQPDGTANTVINMPYIVDFGDGDLPPAPLLPVTISIIETEALRSAGRDLTVMLVDLGPADGWAVTVTALALFDENLSLLDVINVGQDRMNAIRPPLLPISSQDDALLLYSEHGNSNQVYGSYGIVMVRDGKFQVIDTFSTLDDHWCGHERTQRLTLEAPPAGPGYWPFRATVMDRLAEPDPAADCGDEPLAPGFEMPYSVTYSWSASLGQYVADGDAFSRLAAVNEPRY